MKNIFKKVLLGLMVATLFVGNSTMVTMASTATDATTTSANTTEEPETSESTEIIESEKSKYKLRITIGLKEAGWYNEKTDVVVTVEELNDNKKFKMEKVEAKVGSNGSWVDITDDMTFEITENCNVYVKVTDENGAEYEKARFIKCFDKTAPTLNAAVNEGLLTVMTYDTESGMKNVYVNEYSFEPDENGIVSIRLQKFDASYQYFYVYAIDNAGNASQVYTILNPYYKAPVPEGEEEEDTKDPAEDLPDDGDKDVTPPSTGDVTSVTDEDGNDISQEVKMKQFYTIVTKDGQQYFLVIDMSPAYTDDDGVDVTRGNGTVYFLTSVSNDNLLNFVDSDEVTLPHNSVAQGNNIDTNTVTPDMDESTTEETTEEEVVTEEPKEEGDSMMLYIIIFGVVAVVIILVKVMSGKKGKPEQNDDSLYGVEEDEEEEAVSLDELTEDEEE